MKNKKTEQLKTEPMLNQTFSPEKNLKQKPAKFKYYVVSLLKNVIYCLNAYYLIHILLYTQNV